MGSSFKKSGEEVTDQEVGDLDVGVRRNPHEQPVEFGGLQLGLEHSAEIKSLRGKDDRSGQKSRVSWN